MKGPKAPAYDMEIDTDNLLDYDIREWKESLKRPARVSPHPPSPPSEEGGRGKRRRKQIVRVDYTAEAFGSDEEMDFDDDDDSDKDVFTEKDIKEESSSSDEEECVFDSSDSDDEGYKELTKKRGNPKPKSAGRAKSKAKSEVSKAGAENADEEVNPLAAVEGTGKMSEMWKVRIDKRTFISTILFNH